MKRLLRYLVGSLFLARSLFADGTLPFGDGTLPFDMVGNLVQIENGRETVELPIQLYFDRSINAGFFNNTAPGGSNSPEAENQACSRPMNWYRVGGQIVLGSGLSYSIQGVCAVSSAPGKRLVEARRGTELLRLEGSLQANSRTGIQTFLGTATVTANNGRVLQKFRFELNE